MIARENLPNDTVELKGLVYQLLDVVEQQKFLIANQNERIETLFLKNEEQSQQLQTQSQKIEEQAHRIDQLTGQINALKRHQFGKRSEKNQKEIEKEKEEQGEKTTSQDGYGSKTRGALFRVLQNRMVFGAIILWSPSFCP